MGDKEFARGESSQSEAAQPQDYDLHYDGKNLRLYDPDGTMTGEWPGVSGRAGYQDPRFQGVVDKGPLPEGFYLARQSALQTRPTGAWESIKGFFGRGTWPGGQASWGDYRVWLDPFRGTDTLGRSGFSIHGGAVPGSAGCIDLCGAMPSFADAFRATGRDLVLRVQY